MEEISKEMRAMSLPGMARTWLNLCEAHRTESLSLADGIRILLQGEKDSRRSNRTERMMKGAKFRYTVAFAQLKGDAARGLEQSKLDEIAACNFVKNGTPIIVTGPTGSGKSYLASGIGAHLCCCGYSVRYFNVMKLFDEITMSRIESKVPKFFEKVAKTDLVILDDFGIRKLNAEQVLDLMSILEDRHGMKSTMIVSQLPVSEWYDCLKVNTTAADAILDRIIHNAIRFELKGESMRKNN